MLWSVYSVFIVPTVTLRLHWQVLLWRDDDMEIAIKDKEWGGYIEWIGLSEDGDK